MLLSRLVKQHTEPTSFSCLPKPAQKALIQYLCFEAGGYIENKQISLFLQEMDDANEEHWDSIIEMVSQVEDRLFHYAEIDALEVCNTIADMKPEFMDEFPSFDGYHQWYVAQGDIPYYPEDNRYPSIAWCSQSGILDGWHRFHSYLKSGHSTIPLIA